jgi:hypothetical protein
LETATVASIISRINFPGALRHEIDYEKSDRDSAPGLIPDGPSFAILDSHYSPASSDSQPAAVSRNADAVAKAGGGA